MIFASYSRRDKEIVAPLIELLRISRSTVFRDEDSIPPGTKWRLKISAALENCDSVIVFWCRHACESDEVKLEYQRAIKLDKSIIPILLDSTDLPASLAQYQAIDLRTALGEHETMSYSFPVKTGCVGMGGLVLRTPSNEDLQRANEYLFAEIYNISLSKNIKS